MSIAIQDIVLAIAAFGLILALWIGVVLFWSARQAQKAQRIERRLGLNDTEEEEGRILTLWHEGAERLLIVQGDGGKLTFVQRLELGIRAAGWTVTPQALLTRVSIAAGVVGLGMMIATQNALIGLAGVGCTMILVKMWHSHCRGSRSALFEKQFVDAMELAARSLRAGHPLVGALRLVAEEMAPPVSETFAKICQHHELGASMDEALQRGAQVSRTVEMRLFATSVSIQLRSGGNLADMMERLAFVVRDRMRVTRRVRVLTAQTQLSKRILIGLPIILFLLLNFASPKYMEPLYNTTSGQIMLGVGIAGLAIGSWMMNWMATIKY